MNTQQTSERRQPTPYPLRIPPDLRQFLEASAAKNQRSLNGEIIFRLQTLMQGAAA